LVSPKLHATWSSLDGACLGSFCNGWRISRSCLSADLLFCACFRFIDCCLCWSVSEIVQSLVVVLFSFFLFLDQAVPYLIAIDVVQTISYFPGRFLCSYMCSLAILFFSISPSLRSINLANGRLAVRSPAPTHTVNSVFTIFLDLFIL